MPAFRRTTRPALGTTGLVLFLCSALWLTSTPLPIVRSAETSPPSPPNVTPLLTPPTALRATRPAQREGELVVRFRPLATPPLISQLLANVGGQLVRPLRGTSGAVLVRVPRGTEERALHELRRQPLLLWAEPNALLQAEEVTPNDPRFAEQWLYTILASMADAGVPTCTSNKPGKQLLAPPQP